jgi:hypothetical protein
MDLRGQLSNPAVRDKVDLVDALVTRPPGGQSASHVALRDARRPSIRDTLDVEEMAQRFVGGSSIKELALAYAISESSVKRLLRARGARRRVVP